MVKLLLFCSQQLQAPRDRIDTRNEIGANRSHGLLTRSHLCASRIGDEVRREASSSSLLKLGSQFGLVRHAETDDGLAHHFPLMQQPLALGALAERGSISTKSAMRYLSGNFALAHVAESESHRSKQ